MKRKTGFIGTGTMGLPMAQQLANAALEPLIHDLSKDRIAPLLDKGAIWCESLTELAQHCDTVFLSLPGPRQVEAVVAGSGGLLDKLARGSAIVDLSTSSVATARRMEKLCAAKGIGFLDSPVSGGEKRAADGSLILMVGGKEQTLEQVRPQLQLLSREILHLGGAGCGTVAKLINNQLYLCGEILCYEGLALASKAGLDLEQLVHIRDESGAGGVHTKLAERVLAGQRKARELGKTWGGSTPGRLIWLTQDQVDAILSMNESGKSKASIARATGVSRPTVYRIVSQHARLNDDTELQ